MDGVGHSNSLGSVQSVGGISNNSSVGPEGLALGGGPVLALVRLAHGLVADLAMAVSVDWLVGSVVHGGDGSRDWSSNHGGVHGVDGVVDGGVVDSVVHGVGNQLVSTIGAGSNHGEQSSSDESLKIFDPLKKYSPEHSKIFNPFQNF